MLRIATSLFCTALMVNVFGQKPGAVQTTPSSAQFTDAQHGVTFTYPANWSMSTANQFYLGSVFLQNADLRGVVAWKPRQGGTKASTTLAGAQFTYALRKGATPAACMLPRNDEDTTGPHVDRVQIRGIRYAHSRAEDAAMCHHEKDSIYATYRNNTCYLFDLSVHTLCPGVVDGMREATKQELSDMDAQLLNILKTVQIRTTATTIH
jgi:hypothetical protein